MYKKGAGNDKQGKDAGNRTICPYRNFSQAISKVRPSFVTSHSVRIMGLRVKALSTPFSGGPVSFYNLPFHACHRECLRGHS